MQVGDVGPPLFKKFNISPLGVFPVPLHQIGLDRTSHMHCVLYGAKPLASCMLCVFQLALGAVIHFFLRAQMLLSETAGQRQLGAAGGDPACGPLSSRCGAILFPK